MPTSIIHGTVQVEEIKMNARGWLSEVEREKKGVGVDEPIRDDAHH
jgi:hypothetical protein